MRQVLSLPLSVKSGRRRIVGAVSIGVHGSLGKPATSPAPIDEVRGVEKSRVGVLR